MTAVVSTKNRTVVYRGVSIDRCNDAMPIALTELVEDENIEQLAQCAVEATRRAAQTQRDLDPLLIAAIGMIEAVDCDDVDGFDARLEELRAAVAGQTT